MEREGAINCLGGVVVVNDAAGSVDGNRRAADDEGAGARVELEAVDRECGVAKRVVPPNCCTVPVGLIGAVSLFQLAAVLQLLLPPPPSQIVWAPTRVSAAKNRSVETASVRAMRRTRIPNVVPLTPPRVEARSGLTQEIGRRVFTWALGKLSFRVSGYFFELSGLERGRARIGGGIIGNSWVLSIENRVIYLGRISNFPVSWIGPNRVGWASFTKSD